ncbi:hypothetical protein Pfo_013435, partial [Paulownia fortunei]
MPQKLLLLLLQFENGSEDPWNHLNGGDPTFQKGHDHLGLFGSCLFQISNFWQDLITGVPRKWSPAFIYPGNFSVILSFQEIGLKRNATKKEN